MKRGAAPKFKELGSSPAKGKGDNLKRIMSEKKASAKKAGTWYKPGAEPNVPKGSNYPKGFNYKGSSWPDKTPGYESKAKTKMVKDLVSKKPTSTLGRVANIGKKALKTGGRLAGGLGLVAMAYDAYKSGQKHSGGKAVKGQKSFMADAKKNTKSIYKKK